MFLTLLSYSFPSRFVLGRSRGEAMADRRKDELNAYVWHLIHSAAEVAQVFLSCYSQHTQSIFRICVNRGEKDRIVWAFVIGFHKLCCQI